MDKETWELLIESFKRDYTNKKPSYSVILNGIEYELIYDRPYSNFVPEQISIRNKQSSSLIGSMNKDYFNSGTSLDKIHYKENETLINIIDRMEHYNKKMEEERKEEIERRKKKLDSFLYGDGQNV